MKARIIIDGIKVEGDDAKYIINDAVSEAREAGGAKCVAQVVLALVLLFAAPAAGLSASVWIASIVSGYVDHRWVSGAIAGTVGCFLPIAVVVLAYRPLMRLFHGREIRHAMTRHGFELCSACGYWLKGLGADSTRCPECGAKREMGATASERSESAV